MTDLVELEALAEELRGKGEPYAVATVVRTLASVAAKPGAKAIIAADGRMVGWIGGGCALGAVKKAALRAIADGEARLISVMPFDQLKAQGLRPGEERDGVEFAKNMCPSRGVVDIFIEPMLPKPLLLICGSTPVAIAVADLAPRLGLSIAIHVGQGGRGAFAPGAPIVEGFKGLEEATSAAFVVIATQGQGDEEALLAAMRSQAGFIAFVGSRRKVAALKERMAENGIGPERLAILHGPAGISIGAVTPEEIALSVLAELTAERRRDRIQHSSAQRAAAG